MLAAEVDTWCLDCGHEHLMLVASIEEQFDGDCPECNDVTPHELLKEDTE